MQETVPNLKDAASYGNLLVAHANACKKKRHYRAVQNFERNQTELLHQLEQSLLSGEYRTSPYVNKIIIDSGKERKISKLPYYPDRIVHWAIMLQLEPAFLAEFSNRSHAAITGHGIHSALFQTREILLHKPEQSRYCLKIDVRKYFQNIDRDILSSRIRNLTTDQSLLSCVDEIIFSFEQGVPIGNYTSQYLANYYLTPLDVLLTSRGVLFVRYMDDIVIFGESTEYLRGVLEIVREYLRDELRVELKSNWQIFPTAVRGVDFIGYRVFPNRVLLRKSSFKRMRRNLAKIKKHIAEGRFTTSDMSSLGSRSGAVKYCTKSVRKSLYHRYFEEILDSIEGREEYKRKIKRHFQ